MKLTLSGSAVPTSLLQRLSAISVSKLFTHLDESSSSLRWLDDSSRCHHQILVMRMLSEIGVPAL